MRTRIRPEFFERLYAAEPDPWGFETSAYERAKYDATIAALPPGPISTALEVGCSIGVLTERLARRCDRLLAVDVSEAARACGSRPFATGTALDRARRDFELFVLQHRLDPMLTRLGRGALERR